MKQEVKSVRKYSRRIGGHAPQVHVTIVENAKKNTITLSIELLPGRTMHSRRERRKSKIPFRAPDNSIKQYAARPVVGYMNIAQKIELGRRIYVHLKNNPDFADASPDPLALLIITDTLDEAYYMALIGEEKEIKRLGNVERDFNTIYTAVVQYVDKKAKGSAEVYRSAGIEPILVYEKKG